MLAWRLSALLPSGKVLIELVLECVDTGRSDHVLGKTVPRLDHSVREERTAGGWAVPWPHKLLSVATTARPCRRLSLRDVEGDVVNLVVDLVLLYEITTLPAIFESGQAKTASPLLVWQSADYCD